MVGRTNVGGGSSFSATVEITTDANATITLTNLAGDTFSGNADSSGDLTIIVNKPGTYTVTETGASTTKAVVIADDGETYITEIYAFDGTFIADGVQRVNFETQILSGGALPTVTTKTIDNLTVLEVSQPANSASIYRTAEFVDISEYTKIRVRCDRNSSFIYISAFDEQGNQTQISTLPSNYLTSEIGITSLDSTKKYKFGVQLNSGWTVDFVDLKLIP